MTSSTAFLAAKEDKVARVVRVAVPFASVPWVQA